MTRSPLRTLLSCARRTGAVGLAALLGACGGATTVEYPVAEGGLFADFVEPDFPFIVATVDASDVGSLSLERNVATRGVVLPLEDSTYVIFDPDLLRMAIGWRGEFISLTSMAQISYQEPLNKNNRIPRVLGQPVFATGVYPGWATGAPSFTDPRAPGPYAEDPGRGPLPASQARWEGIHVVGDRAVLSYTVGGTEIHETPSSVNVEGQVGIVRTIQTGPVSQALTLVAAEAPAAARAQVEGNIVTFFEAAGDSVIMVGLVDAPDGAQLRVVDDRYATVELPAGAGSSLFRAVVWRGVESATGGFAAMLAGPTQMINYAKGGPGLWNIEIETAGEVAPDSSAYVVDRVGLPLDNPWHRNVRPSDIAFFSDGRAAVSTFEGDVWIVRGLDASLDRVRWKRFASGLFEPMSLEIVDDEIFVYSRSGLIRPHDLNRDGEADFYENFSDLPIQTMESREFPLSMGRKPDGGFYLSRGGALDNGPRTSPAIMPGFRAGSAQSGTVMEISADGRSMRSFATGLREPFIAVHPESGIITSSDQQGNFVPSTPVYRIVEGAYYGVVPTAHQADTSEIGNALVWIPHEIDQSGSGQAWVTDDRMGFGGDALVHLSYGLPGAFRVYFDEATGGTQGAAILLSSDFEAPLLKAEVSPQDGNLYVAGFQIWGTRSEGIRTLSRIRHTGVASPLPSAVSAGEQGVLITFDVPLDPATVSDLTRYTVSRWDYRRTSAYGSGHFRLDGAPGEERLPVAAAHLSADGRSLLLLIPDMEQVMQLQISYDLRSAEDMAVADTLYLTLNQVNRIDLATAGFGDVDWRAQLASAGAIQGPIEGVASASHGEEVFQRIGCVACHSVDGTTAGKLGPTFRGLFGSMVTLVDGSTVEANAAYLRRSIEEPGAQIVEGYQEGMPAYLGVLSDTEIESIVQYIQSLE